ncbi:MAG: hypothetical protein JSW12_05185 [Deltaproteobacteria bacterium]|nr:MAG: hypothetical protein JSW12_05185 [Deltaproteobacteria bacterium]
MKPENFQNKVVLIAGGGYFGSQAVIISKDVNAKVVVIDNKIDCEASVFIDEIIRETNVQKTSDVKAGAAALFVCDAVEFTVRLMMMASPDYIVPAMQGHFAGKLVKKWLECEGLEVRSTSNVLENVLKDIPQSLILHCDKEMGVIITSYMSKGNLCEVPCDQPIDICPSTGIAKMGPMHHILAYATHDKVTLSKILVGHTLWGRKGGEVGYFQGSALMSFLSDTKQLKTPYSLAVGTACDCHGILNLFYVSPC